MSKAAALRERVLLVTGGFVMMFPGAITLRVGASALTVAIVGHLRRGRIEQSASETGASCGVPKGPSCATGEVQSRFRSQSRINKFDMGCYLGSSMFVSVGTEIIGKDDKCI